MVDFLLSGPVEGSATFVFAHGAGAPMDSAWMNQMAELLAERQIRTARFEFAYMAARRTGEGRKPAPRAEKAMPEFLAAVEALGAEKPLLIGGKSMGGRVASMVAQELFDAGTIAGVVCLGYPFHPPEQPDKLRTAHLETLTVPTLICQGTRDPFGTRDEVLGYGLPSTIQLHWLEDGDHDLRPRRQSGRSARQNMAQAADAIAEWTAKSGLLTAAARTAARRSP